MRNCLNLNSKKILILSIFNKLYNNGINLTEGAGRDLMVFCRFINSRFQKIYVESSASYAQPLNKSTKRNHQSSSKRRNLVSGLADDQKRNYL